MKPQLFYSIVLAGFVGLLLVSGCPSWQPAQSAPAAPIPTAGRYQIAISGATNEVFLLDTATGRLWVRRPDQDPKEVARSASRGWGRILTPVD